MQLETKEAVECIEEICAVPGLDSIVFGQMDFSGSLGFPHCPTWAEIEEEPQMLEAMERACAACKASGVHCGVSTGDKRTVSEVCKRVDNKAWVHIGADLASMVGAIDSLFADTKAGILPLKPKL